MMLAMRKQLNCVRSNDIDQYRSWLTLVNQSTVFMSHKHQNNNNENELKKRFPFRFNNTLSRMARGSCCQNRSDSAPVPIINRNKRRRAIPYDQTSIRRRYVNGDVKSLQYPK
jgi:hypothetical protein